MIESEDQIALLEDATGLICWVEIRGFGYGIRLFLEKIHKGLSGVYAIMIGREIAYIGSTKNLFQRASRHEHKTEDEDCAIYVHRCENEQFVERMLIQKIRPKINYHLTLNAPAKV